MLVEIIGKKNEEKILTTSRKIAEKFQKEHHEVIYAIEGRISENAKDVKIKNKGIINELIEAGISHVEDYFILSEYESRGKKYKEYLVTRDGFSLLAMGFTGSEAVKWKLEYISAFNAMENELKRIYTERQQWQIERDKGVVIRHILTDTIKMKIADSSHKRFAYPNYTNLIYRTLFNKSAKELEQEYGVKPKENLRDYFTGGDLEKVQSAEMLISSLISCGWGYKEIKDFLVNQSKMLISAE